MNLQPIPQSASSKRFVAQRLGTWELGRCVAPSITQHGTPTGRECGQLVFDDGTGYADLDGQPFQTYICRQCGPRLLAE